MTTILRSDDFTCPSCVSGIETVLNATEGVESATVHFTSGRIEIRHDPERIDAAGLVRALKRLGYAARPSGMK